MLTCTSKTYLNFIGNAESSILPHMLVGLLQEAIRKRNLPSTAKHGFTDERCGGGSLSGNFFTDFEDLISIKLSRSSWISIQPAIQIRHRNLMYPFRRTSSTRTVVFVGTDIYIRFCIAVICFLEYNHVLLSVDRAGNPQGKFVCFASGTDKKTSVKRLREQPAKTLRILNIDRVQISGIGVQNISLIALCLCNIWMRMTHMSNIVDAVQIKLSFGVNQRLPLTSNNYERFLIRKTQ